MRVQRVLMPDSEAESWTLLGDDLMPVEPVERFLAYLAAIERSPNTVKAYAHDLKDWWTYLAGRGLDWRAVTLEEVGGFVAWLPPPSMQISWPRTPAPPFERERDASPTDMEACLTTRLLGDRDTVWSHRISRAETQTHQTPRRVRW